MSTAKATHTEIDEFLQTHNEWTLTDDALQRTFREAFGFMAEAALVAERSSHHPEWSNVYNRVTVKLTTHDAGGISAKDFELARQMELIASRR